LSKTHTLTSNSLISPFFSLDIFTIAAMASSSHLQNIPEAVRIASVTGPSDPELRKQAIEYLDKVKTLCDETWQVGPLREDRADGQDCLALYLQGAGAESAGKTGKDGKQKLGTELRLYCEQVFETALIMK
jgi:exportin-T